MAIGSRFAHAVMKSSILVQYTVENGITATVVHSRRGACIFARASNAQGGGARRSREGAGGGRAYAYRLGADSCASGRTRGNTCARVSREDRKSTRLNSSHM